MAPDEIPNSESFHKKAIKSRVLWPGYWSMFLFHVRFVLIIHENNIYLHVCYVYIPIEIPGIRKWNFGDDTNRFAKVQSFRVNNPVFRMNISIKVCSKRFVPFWVFVYIGNCRCGMEKHFHCNDCNETDDVIGDEQRFKPLIIVIIFALANDFCQSRLFESEK